MLSIQGLRSTSLALSVPPEVVPYHFVKLHVERPIKVLQLLNDLLVDLHMCPALGLAEAARLAATLWLLQAREAFCSVEVEVLVRDDALEA